MSGELTLFSFHLNSFTGYHVLTYGTDTISMEFTHVGFSHLTEDYGPNIVECLLLIGHLVVE